MMYDEFLDRINANKPSYAVYKVTIEPVYNYIPNMTKDFCAKMYDELGISVFIGLRDYALKIAKKEEEYRKSKTETEQHKKELEDLLCGMGM